MRGNIDHLEQPEEYHKMAVPGKLKFLWNIKLKFLIENNNHQVASEYLYPYPVSSRQRILLPPPCQQSPANTFPPTLSAVASEYLYPHPISGVFLSFVCLILVNWRKTVHESSKIFNEHAWHIARL